jgi:UDP-glucuronate 4-epimerase
MYLITGAAGFIGFHISLELLKKNEKVIGVDNINNYYDKRIKYNRLKILKQFPKFKFFKIDLNNKKNFSKKINKYKNKIELIIHLAGQAGVRYSIFNPGTYIQNNIMSYVQLLEFFKNSSKNKLILYASSSSIYGEAGSKIALSSEAQTKPISVYSASKLSMELISNVYNSLYKMNFIGVRFFSVYGPWGRPDMFYFKFLQKTKNNKPIEIYNFGNHHRSFTYIDDVVLNIMKLIKKFKNSKRSLCDIFNIGNPKSISLKKFIDVLEKSTGKKAKKIYTKKHPGDLTVTRSNVKREKNIFNHETRVSLKEGIMKLISWHKSYYK